MTEKAVTPGCVDLNELEIQGELGAPVDLLWSLALLLLQPV